VIQSHSVCLIAFLSNNAECFFINKVTEQDDTVASASEVYRGRCYKCILNIRLPYFNTQHEYTFY